MPKRRNAEVVDDDVQYEGISSSQGHHTKYRVHYSAESGPLYIANFSTRSICESNVPTRANGVDEPRVFLEKKPQRSQGITFGRGKSGEISAQTTALITSNLTESERNFKSLEYSGTTQKLSAVENHRKLYVAFLNKKTRKMSIVPASSVFMRPAMDVVEEEQPDAQVPETPDANRQRVQDLTFAFGSHKKQQLLKSANERKSLASDAVNTAIETAMHEAKTTKAAKKEEAEGEESQGAEDKPEVAATGDDFDFGPPNVSAHSPHLIFPVEQVVPEELLSALQPLSREKQSELPVLVRRCLTGSSKQEDSQLRLLTYLRILIEMYKARGAKVKKGDCIPRNLPPGVRNVMFTRFMVAIESAGEGKTWSIPPRLRTRLQAHIILLSMHVFAAAGNSFAVNVSDLQADLALAPRTLVSVARHFGCSINSASSSSGGNQVIVLNAPYRPPAPMTGKGARKGSR